LNAVLDLPGEATVVRHRDHGFAVQGHEIPQQFKHLSGTDVAGSLFINRRPRVFREDRMSKLRANALVLVGDGRKALFLRNHGDAIFPNLRTEQVFEDENPSTHEQGAERPGRVSKGPHSSGLRSSVEPTDWHEIEEHQFARRIAATVEQMVRASKVKALILVAPPKTLAELRSALHSDVKACVVAEINKDLTRHPIAEIEKHLMAEASAS
jgi:protein required for attachment to host cells